MKPLRRALRHTLPLLATLAATAAGAAGTPPLSSSASAVLGLDPGLALVTFGDALLRNSQINGAAAVGGNAVVSSYSLGGLSVAHDLDFQSGSIRGNAVVGGHLTSSYAGSFGGSVRVGAGLDARAGLSAPAGATTVWGPLTGVQPWYPAVQAGSGSFALGLDFQALSRRLSALSASVDGFANTGSAQLQWGTLHFDASGQTLAVFDIDAAELGHHLQIDNLAADAAVLINVHGSSVAFGNGGYSNFASGRVLFNLPEATTLSFDAGLNASLLAVQASVQPGYGSITGQVVVDRWNSSVQINPATFSAMLPAAPVPEPGKLSLLLAGLAVVGLLARRRQRHRAERA